MLNHFHILHSTFWKFPPRLLSSYTPHLESFLLPSSVLTLHILKVSSSPSSVLTLHIWKVSSSPSSVLTLHILKVWLQCRESKTLSRGWRQCLKYLYQYQISLNILPKHTIYIHFVSRFAHQAIFCSYCNHFHQLIFPLIFLLTVLYSKYVIFGM